MLLSLRRLQLVGQIPGRATRHRHAISLLALEGCVVFQPTNPLREYYMQTIVFPDELRVQRMRARSVVVESLSASGPYQARNSLAFAK